MLFYYNKRKYFNKITSQKTKKEADSSTAFAIDERRRSYRQKI